MLFANSGFIEVWNKFTKAQNPSHRFPRNFPVEGEAANLLSTCYGLVVYVVDLLRTCYDNLSTAS